MKKTLSIIISVMMLAVAFPFTVNADMTYSEEKWSADQTITIDYGYKYAGADYVYGKPGETVDTEKTLGTNMGLSNNASHTTLNGMHAYFKWDISGYDVDAVSYAHVKFYTDNNNFNIYSLPESDWDTDTAPALTNATNITKTVSEVGDLYEDYTSGNTTIRARNLDVTSAVKTAITEGQSSFILVVEASHATNATYIHGLNNASRKPALQLKAIEEQTIEETSYTTKKDAWNADQTITIDYGYKYAGTSYIYGKPGETVDTEKTLGTNMGLSNNASHATMNGMHAYFKWDISGYDVDAVSYAHVKFYTDNNNFNIYSLPESDWDTDTAPALTNATNITKTVSEVGDLYEDYTSGNTTIRARNLDVTSAVKTAITEGQSSFILVVEASHATNATYIHGLNNASRKPALQLKTSKSIIVAGAFAGTVAAGETLTLDYAIENGWDEAVDVDCYIAVYDGDGRLSYVSADSFTVASVGSKHDQFTYTIPIDAGDMTGYTARAMIWKDDVVPLINTAVPLTAISN